MENDLDKTLGIESETRTDETNVTGNGAEKTLKAFAIVILVCGILAFIIMLLVGFVMVADREPETGWPLVISAIPVLLGSLIQWAFITVICNISNNLRDINRKTK